MSFFDNFDRNTNKMFGLFGLFFVVMIILSMIQFSIVKKECEEAGEKKCFTKAMREMQSNGRNISVDFDE